MFFFPPQCCLKTFPSDSLKCGTACERVRSCITGYVVEMKPKDSDNWVRYNDYPCPDNKMVINDLVENSEMEFRVMAQNAAGFSEPSGASSPIKIKEKIGNYCFVLFF